MEYRFLTLTFMKYQMTCTCGQVMAVDADSRDAAVAQLKEMMTEEAIAQHFAEKHVGEQPLTLEQSNAGIEQNVVEAA